MRYSKPILSSSNSVVLQESTYLESNCKMCYPKSEFRRASRKDMENEIHEMDSCLSLRY